MHYLVIDTRYGTPIHVLLDLDPRSAAGFPGLAVREVTLEQPGGLPAGPAGVAATVAVGRHPWQADLFREFPSDRAVGGAGFGLVEPRYVGINWESYVHQFHPEGGRRPSKPPPRPIPVVKPDQ